MKELDDIAEEAARELFPNYADVSFSRLIIRSAIDKAIEVVLTREPSAEIIQVAEDTMFDGAGYVDESSITFSLWKNVYRTIQAALLAEIKGEGDA